VLNKPRYCKYGILQGNKNLYFFLKRTSKRAACYIKKEGSPDMHYTEIKTPPPQHEQQSLHRPKQEKKIAHEKKTYILLIAYYWMNSTDSCLYNVSPFF
jgi:hypothetical protein